MALTQQLARVTPAYLERCRATAANSPTAAPGWDPPLEDTLDLDWAIWGLARMLRRSGHDPAVLRMIDQAIATEGGAALDYLVHDDVYDGFDGPPMLVEPAAVSALAGALAAMDVDAALDRLPSDADEAARVCGFGWFRGDLRAYLRGHVEALRAFYVEAASRGLAVVAWVD
ncbi:DUF1877 family protein [Yinghuangia seranimata]|uniref:DUF1877 family protein n=1 Tax=Yinghuangia seranimata TaxID=408067 RepID=UPI00248D2CEB|nr:DUF1877 family protein [Yinghuangia seranimata]MDI2132119.1 DUF1877 family protein [Yinghuangia seranimata]